jgi:predicted nuclease of predicted toxin-antitoxin system
VLAVSEVTQRSVDSVLIEQSAREQRILLTEDKDFGWLVFVSRADSAGVILIRFPGNARETLTRTMMRVIQEQGKTLLGCFVVVQPGHVRISRR